MLTRLLSPLSPLAHMIIWCVCLALISAMVPFIYGGLQQ
jgi:hypothetical protein